MLKIEKNFINKKNIDEFREKVIDTKIKTYSLLNSIKIKGKKIFGVGAPSRATTLVNYLGLDPACDLDVVPNYSQELKSVDVVLNNSFAFGGMNAVLALKKYLN